MIRCEIAIVGAGLAGSAAAVMLGRAGCDVALIDPRPVYRPDFRCEKIDGPQMAVLDRTGLGETVRCAATHDGESWIARRGRVVEKRPGDQWGILYQDLVNTIRGELPPTVTFVCDKAKAVKSGTNHQSVTLAGGETVAARLVIMANGLNFGLREQLDIRRRVLNEAHSISAGFDLKPAGADFRFPALTYYSDRPSEQLAYLTLFLIGSTMRANLFTYHSPDDPWLRRFKESPEDMLCAGLPRLRDIVGDFTVGGPVRIRPADLYVSEACVKPGLVLVGDAYSTSCPAAGTGTLKAFTDVERLCNKHVPHWLATPGMDVDKIAEFYADPQKIACEAFSLSKARSLRSMLTGTGARDVARRWVRFKGQICRGMLRQAGTAISDLGRANYNKRKTAS